MRGASDGVAVASRNMFSEKGERGGRDRREIDYKRWREVYGRELTRTLASFSLSGYLIVISMNLLQ